MNFRRNSRSKAAPVQMASLMDVIFLLLCFFVTVSVFSQWESEISIRLPTAKTAEAPERLPGEIIVNLAKDGSIKVNGATMSLADLQSKLSRIAKFYPGQPVIIRADKETKYDHLVGVIDACRAGDVWNFSLATQNDTGEPK